MIGGMAAVQWLVIPFRRPFGKRLPQAQQLIAVPSASLPGSSAATSPAAISESRPARYDEAVAARPRQVGAN
jgi:hypothetical protein